MQPVTGQSRPGYASPPMPPRPSAPVLRGSCRGPPRVRGWAMGGGSVGGELVRRAGELARRAGARHPGSSPSWWPGAPLASPCRRGVVRSQLAGGLPPGVRGRVVPSERSRQGRLRAVGGRGPARHWPCVAVPGGRPWWSARGSVPRWRAWAGAGLAAGPSSTRVATVPVVRAPLPPRRVLRGGRHRARFARPVAKCVWARCRGRSSPLTPRRAGSSGVPPRRRGGRRRGPDPRPL